MKKLLLIVLTIASISASTQIQFTYVDPFTQTFMLKNFGSEVVDFCSHELCSEFTYTTLDNTSGDCVLSPGETQTYQWIDGTAFSTTGSDLALYIPGANFSDGLDMVSFVQYFTTGNPREDEAEEGGLWAAGTTVMGDAPFVYTGNGLQSGVEFWESYVPPPSDIVINEIDSDTPGADAFEFVELFGAPNEPLDDMVLVFFNGSSDTSYEVFDLEGNTCDADGFFVVGNAAVAGVSIVFPDNSMQNGTEAVALYWGNSTNFPNGTAVTAANLIDAVVYDTDDVDDIGLIDVLTPGQWQVNEEEGGDGTVLSLSRVPNGGDQLNTSSYVTQTPTPGSTNVLPCEGGLVETIDEQTSTTVCTDINNTTLVFQTGSSFPGDAYWYVVTDATDNIVFYSETSTVDFNALPSGEYHVYGLSYTGTIDLSTLEAGDAIIAIDGSLCVSSSTNFVTVMAELCNVVTCNGGLVLGNDTDDLFTICADETTDVITFSYMTPGDASSYEFILTNQSGVIVQYPAGTSFDFNSLGDGTYLVYGISFDGPLDLTTLDAGDFITEIETDGQCLDVSDTPITVIVQDCGTAEECDLLFFSEYVEGTSDNKAIEVFNPTNFELNLEEYEIALYHNGNSDPTTTFLIPGTLGPQQSFVIVNQEASATLLDLGDVTSFVTEFNGDDVIELRHNGIPIDVFGIVGTDPGNFWTVNGGNSMDHTLVRKPTVTSPVTDWAVGQTQWDVYPVDDFSHLGTHEYDQCITTVPQISFSASAQGGIEGEDVVVTVNVFNPVAEVLVDVTITGGSAIEDVDYTSTLPITLTFPQGNTDSQSFTVSIIDDTEVEASFEIITISLSGNENDVDFLLQNHNIVISPSDLVYPIYTIEEVTTNNSEGEADSLGVICELHGIVHGINFNAFGLDFTLIDGDDGINVFSAVDDLNYTVQEGDSIHMKGEIWQFGGLTTTLVAEIQMMTSGNALQQTTTVSQITEENESAMVRIECVEIVDPSEWTNEGLDFVVTVSDGVNEFALLIESECALYGMDPLEGHFSVVGIGHQRDELLPFDSDYMMRPRYLSDIEDQLIAAFVAPLVLDQDNVFAITNTSVGATSYFWDFGDGNTSIDDDPAHQYSDSFIENLDGSTVTITLIAENNDGCVDSTSIEVDVIFIDVDENVESSFAIYPNPAEEVVNVKSDATMQRIYVTNQLGEMVMNEDAVNATSTVLSISQLANGMYQLHIIAEDKVEHVMKLVVR
ncbi:MAG: T9SS type A sorting domain-containing protein [Flavobacteriales bacterium]|nr:T9SS type A sorting domain-containing protein [Flavobacteriales bacterium]